SYAAYRFLHSFPTRRSSDLYRRTLVEFGRDLNSETDLNKMFDLVVERLSQTLFVARLAIFTAASDDSGTFHMAKSYGITWADQRSEEHTSELQSRGHLVCRL